MTNVTFNPDLGIGILIAGGSVAVFLGSIVLYQNKKYKMKNKKRRKK